MACLVCFPSEVPPPQVPTGLSGSDAAPEGWCCIVAGSETDERDGDVEDSLFFNFLSFLAFLSLRPECLLPPP